MPPIGAEELHRLRNELPVLGVVFDLGVETAWRGRRLAFRCPLCHGFDTAFPPRTDLARCFRCRRSFNPVDLVLAARPWSFLETVRYLERLHHGAC